MNNNNDNSLAHNLNERISIEYKQFAMIYSFQAFLTNNMYTITWFEVVWSDNLDFKIFFVYSYIVSSISI